MSKVAANAHVDPGRLWPTGSLAQQAERPASVTWVEGIALAAVLLLATALNFYRLSANGYGNIYYATAVRSMLESGHNFFFVSFDPGGFLSVDKPPLGLWLQAISARVLGFSWLGLLLPQAVAGVVSVALLWRLVRTSFGPEAGVLAGLALAVTPVSVITSRDNVLDGLLVPFLLAGAWALQRALRAGTLRWLLLAAVLVGLGFNVKALEAYLVVPAFALVYLLGAPRGWGLRIGQLALAGTVLAVISLSWVTIVDLTPASQRPYVGSTTDDSELSLTLGYNGIFRILGEPRHAPPAEAAQRRTSPAVRVPAEPQAVMATIQAYRLLASETTNKQSAVPDPIQGFPGAWRLFQPALGGQLSWLLPLALIGLLAAIRLPGRQRRMPRTWRDLLTWRLNTRQQGYLLWTAWLLAAWFVFSFSRVLNVYYLSVLAPAVCALAAIGMIALWRGYLAGGRGSWLLPLAVLATGIEQAALLGAAPKWNPWLRPLVLVVSLGLAAVLVAVRASPRLARGIADRVLPVGHGERALAWRARVAPVLSLGAGGVAAAALGLLLVAPTLWTLGSLTTGNAGNWPSAGPQHAQAGGPYFPYADPHFMRYLATHRGAAPFELATVNTDAAEPIILATGAPVMAMGGFTGDDQILTLDDLASMVSQGTVSYFLLPAANVTRYQLRALFPQISQSTFEAWHAQYTNALSHWVSARCLPVPPQVWTTQPPFTARRYPSPYELYDCSALVGKAPNPTLPAPATGTGAGQ
ncbi:MAG TPA: glycosyltransferase family 39 protein [Ktedonobacterales bacterium]